MKRPKRNTRKQKILLSSMGYDPKRYTLLYELDNCLVLRDKVKELDMVVDKPTRRR